MVHSHALARPRQLVSDSWVDGGGDGLGFGREQRGDEDRGEADRGGDDKDDAVAGGGCDGDQDREPDRSADLTGRVDEPRCDTGEAAPLAACRGWEQAIATITPTGNRSFGRATVAGSADFSMDICTAFLSRQ